MMTWIMVHWLPDGTKPRPEPKLNVLCFCLRNYRHIGQMQDKLNKKYGNRALTILFLPGLVADSRPKVHGVAIVHGTLKTADQHSQAGLLEYVNIVIICVSHGPTAAMAPSLLDVSGIHEATVTGRPVLERVVVYNLERNMDGVS